MSGGWASSAKCESVVRVSVVEPSVIASSGAPGGVDPLLRSDGRGTVDVWNDHTTPCKAQHAAGRGFCRPAAMPAIHRTACGSHLMAAGVWHLRRWAASTKPSLTTELCWRLRRRTPLHGTTLAMRTQVGWGRVDGWWGGQRGCRVGSCVEQPGQCVRRWVGWNNSCCIFL